MIHDELTTETSQISRDLWLTAFDAVEHVEHTTGLKDALTTRELSMLLGKGQPRTRLHLTTLLEQKKVRRTFKFIRDSGGRFQRVPAWVLL